jgi:hypothetical protein
VVDDLRTRLDYEDGKLLAECEVHTFRASGPGGQKRNKTSSAVRLVHGPSGLTVKAAESRSQHENKAHALRRLRTAIAIRFRCPLPDRITWPETVQIADGTLRLNRSNPANDHVIGLVLDAMFAAGGSAAGAAKCLGITQSSLKRFLNEHPAALGELSRMGGANRADG